MKNRDYSLDCIRIFALFTVVSVHFFLNSGFYQRPVVGISMLVQCIIRSFFMICVPLFLLLTGYLMKNKELSIKYYKGIGNTLFVYVLASIACVLFKNIYYPNEHHNLLLSILNFTGANYAWYIEMYIGLFFIIPFLNLIYNNLKNQRQRKLLILTMLCMTSIPCVLNIFVFDSSSWWSQPSLIQTYQKIIPSYWVSMYPITYYFIGSYLHDYGLKLNNIQCLIVMIVSTVLVGLISYCWATPNNFIWGSWADFGSFFTAITASCVFMLIKRNITFNNLSNERKFFLSKVANLTLGGYLVSYIIDTIIYSFFKNRINSDYLGLRYYFIIIPLVFVYSVLLSYLLDFIQKGTNKIYSLIKRVIRN